MKNAADIKILALDSSSTTGSVALCCGERLVAESILNVKSTHSEKLLVQIDLLLHEAGWSIADLDLLAVVTGPGAFTGLRIGIATIKGLAQVLDTPVVAVSSLQAIAMNLPLVTAPICAFLDARKSEVYSQLFRWDCIQGAVAVSEATVLPPQQLLTELSGNVALVGNGVNLYRQLITEVLADNALLPVATAHQLRATAVAWLALQSWKQRILTNAAEIVPNYIRPSDAELNYKKQSKG